MTKRKRGRFTPSRRDIDEFVAATAPRRLTGIEPMARLEARAELYARRLRPPCAKSRCNNHADAEVWIIWPGPEGTPLPLCAPHASEFSNVMLLVGWRGGNPFSMRLGFNALTGGAYDKEGA
jgi:hypothetical protein